MSPSVSGFCLPVRGAHGDFLSVRSNPGTFLAALILCLTLFPASPLRAESRWIRLQTPHFDVVSEAPAEKSREALLRFEQLRLAMTNGLFPGRINPLPTRILMLIGSERVTRIVTDGREGGLGVDGGYVNGASDNFIVMDIEDDLRSGFRVSQHEYIHLLARNQSRFWPLWLNEGFASCFESAVVEKKRIVFGKPMQRIAEILREKRGLDLEQVFGFRTSAELFRLPTTQSRWFYPQSWLLTHYLLFGLPPEEEAKMGRFFLALGSGSDSAEAFQKAFGWTVPELQKRLDAYADRGRFRFREMPTAGGVVEISIGEETPATSAAWIALMQMELGRYASADKAMEVAVREGGGSWTDLVLGLRDGRNTNHVEAMAKLKKARAAEPGRPQFDYFLVQELLSGDKLEASEARSIIKGVLERNPTHGDYWRLLGLAERAAGGSRQAALDAYTKALGLNPLDLEARYSAALVLRDAGEKGHARGNLQQVVRLARDPILLAAAQIALKELEEKP